MDTLDNNIADKVVKSEIKDLWQNFGGYCTLHGLHYLFDAPSRFRKFLWALLLLGSSVTFGMLVLLGYIKWAKHEVFITTEYVHNDFLTFPAISICGLNMMKKSSIEGTDAQLYLDGIDYRMQYRWNTIYSKMNKSFNPEEAVRTYGHKYGDIIKKCSFEGGPCGEKNTTMFFDYKYGLCYTFNSGKQGQKAVPIGKTGSNWHAAFLLDAQPEEYYGFFSRRATGFKVTIHNQSVLPIPADDGWNVSPGFVTSFKVDERRIIRQEAPYTSNCTTKKVGTDIFTVGYCRADCSAKKIMKLCKCQVLGFPESAKTNIRYCNQTDITSCVNVKIPRIGYKSCDCSTPCDSTAYKTEVSMLYYPSESSWKVVSSDIKRQYDIYNATTPAADRKPFREWYRSRFALITVYFGSMVTEITREVPAYEFSDLASDFGGNMGLFLGCSILTLCELIDVIILTVIARCNKKQKVQATDK